MNTSRKIKSDLWYIGASDRRLALFENVMPVPQGVSYNSYLITDDKTVLLDSVDNAVAPQFLENLTAVLNGRTLDYIVVHHVEPDHLASLQEVLIRYPQAVILCSMQASRLIPQFFDMPENCQIQVVKEGETLETGHHTLTFYAAPMVHWPEVLVSYDSVDKILFSADAFGTFGALSGNLYADEVNFDRDWLDDARRYYTNIVGKYGVQVQNLLKKAATLDIQMICPLHGPVWRENLGYFIGKYDLWSRYEPEDKDGIIIIYGSMYGHTESAATTLAGILADKGVRNIKMYDVSVTHVSYLLSETFRCGSIVLLSPTYNNGLYPPMETYLLDVQAHFVEHRTFAVLENGSWSPAAGKCIQNIFQNMKPNNIEGPVVTIKSSMKQEQLPELEKLAENLLN
ncbi:MAG: FprA family A-type flavoprotein [Bacteroidales bacterium]|nr:FprA family A-type flavoprotein [Bacteroidales bacterium]